MPPFVTSLNRAAVIIPPIQDFYVTPHRMSSLGIRIVQHILEETNFKVQIIDAMETPIRKNQLPLPPALSYLQPHLLPQETGKCSFFSKFRHFGKSFEVIVEQIIDFNPTLCFIGCFAYSYSGPVTELSKRIKKRLPHTTIVAGGAGVSVHPDHFLQEAAIDYTLSGEAEVCLAPFLEFFIKKSTDPGHVPNLGWKEGLRRNNSSMFISTTEATIEPIIAKVEDTAYRTVYSTSLSRGCPSMCRFCANHLTHGRQFHHCTIKRFEELLRELPQPPGLKKVHLNFEDDNLLCDMSFFRSVLDRCREVFQNVRFAAENGIDYRLMPPELCNELIDAGFRQFNFTLGSVSQKMLDRAERTADIDRYDQLLACAAKRDIPVITYVICGFPEETKKSIAENLRFLLSRKTTTGVSLFYPVPGIPGFNDRVMFDTIVPQTCAGSSAYPWSRHLTTGTLVTAFRLARLINLMKASIKSNEESALIERTFSTGRLHTIVKERGQRRIVEVPRQDAELVEMVVQRR